MVEKIGGRKFVLTLLAVFLSFVLVLLDKITAKEFLDFVMVVAGVYTAGNVATKFTSSK